MNRSAFWTLLSICAALFWVRALTEDEVELLGKGKRPDAVH